MITANQMNSKESKRMDVFEWNKKCTQIKIVCESFNTVFIFSINELGFNSGFNWIVDDLIVLAGWYLTWRTVFWLSEILFVFLNFSEFFNYFLRFKVFRSEYRFGVVVLFRKWLHLSLKLFINRLLRIKLLRILFHF